MSWCRLHADMSQDPKMRAMPCESRWMFIELLNRATLYNQGGNTGVTAQEFSLFSEFSSKIFWKFFKILKNSGIIFENKEEKILVKNWDKRQFESDKSAERVAKHRSLKREQKINKTQCNVTVTPPDTDTDTDTDTDKKSVTVYEVGGVTSTVSHHQFFEPENFVAPPDCLPCPPATPSPFAPPPVDAPMPTASPPPPQPQRRPFDPPTQLAAWQADPQFAAGFAKAYPATGLPNSNAGMAEIYGLYRRLLTERAATGEVLTKAAREYGIYLQNACKPAKNCSDWLKFAADGWDCRWAARTEDLHATRNAAASRPAPWLAGTEIPPLPAGVEAIPF